MEVLMWTFFLVLLCCGKSQDTEDTELFKTPEGDLHVVLVAGSNGWWNYRHQADVAHAYQLLRRNGVPEEKIIVMMYDDVACYPDNPYRGKLFNRPDGKDVYAGLKIDYYGSSVTPQNFLSVLQGNAENVTGGSGRVINSKPDDRIFVYFTDHGGYGLIAFPDDVLTVEDLNTALIDMHKRKRYGHFVFYMEACESGSMFQAVLKKDLKIYAVTAADALESSWGTYCDNDMDLPCLGDLFSVNWMQDTERQFKNVKALTNLSHVMHYGDLRLAGEPISWFEGGSKKKTTTPMFSNADTYEEQHPKVSWPSRDIELMHLQKLMNTAKNAQVSKTLERKIARIHEDRRNIEALFNSLVANLLASANDRYSYYARLERKCSEHIYSAR
ncbi:unnamed protein product [Angiostrongylus costaricensis]|uniref:legumain n=1 Tax=Angiostrongylus costaricensis TaxID=334426 RepID=A0A0R3PEV5_ANGCS|nr:unnamed protein product [Angiostrongylus costaricensis]